MEQNGYTASTSNPAPSNLDAVFSALADPTRRAILSRLAEGEASVNEIAAPFEMSQPAVSRHLKVLERAGLIERDVDEQRRPARLKAEKMVLAVDWLTEFKAFWQTSFTQLDDVLMQMKLANKERQIMSELPEYVLDREFDAPIDMVWRAWTDPELLARWYGPGVETIIHKFELKPGGVWLNEMKWGEKSDLSKMAFKEIVPQEKMVWHHSSTDSDWNVVPNPMMPDWPQTLLTTVIFEEKGGKTSVRLTQIPIDASDAEIACFAKMMSGMDNGWGGGYKIMDEIFSELQA